MKIQAYLVFMAFVFITGCSSSRPITTANVEETFGLIQAIQPGVELNF